MTRDEALRYIEAARADLLAMRPDWTNTVHECPDDGGSWMYWPNDPDSPEFVKEGERDAWFARKKAQV